MTSSSPRSRLSGTLCMIGAGLSFSLTGLSAKMLSPQIDPPQLVLLRSAFMVVVVAAWALSRGEPLWVLKKREGLLLLLRGFLGTCGFLLFFGALQRLPLADTVIIFQAHPLVVAALAPWLLKEKNRPVHWLLMVVSLMGVALVVGPSATGEITGRAMALGCALVAGCGYSVVRLLRANVPTLTIALAFPAVAVAFSGPLIALGVPGFGWFAPTATDWMWILSVAVTSTAGQILLTVGIGRVPAARGSALSNLQAVFAMIWGVLLLGEIPGWHTVVGAAVVIGAMILLNRYKAGVVEHPPDGYLAPMADGKPRRWRILLAVAIVVALLAVAGVVTIHFIENRLIFHPEHTPRKSTTELMGGVKVQDRWMETEDGVRIHGWLAGDVSTGPVVLFCHGNAGNITHRAHLVSGLVDQGLGMFIFDYRGFGQSEGRPDEQGVYADARAAHALLVDDLDVEPSRLVLFGRSLGGAVAINLATERPASALIVESSFTSAPDMARIIFGGLPVQKLARSRFASIDKVDDLTLPKLFLHGDRDDLIPFEMGKRLYEAAAEPKQFIGFEGADHNDAPLVVGPEYFEIIANFVRDNST